MGKIVVGGTLVLAALGLCGACTELVTVEIDVVEELVKDLVLVVAVTRGGSEERS
jgi:hypothetical protein